MNLRLDAAERAELNRCMIRLTDGDRAAFQPIFEALWPRMRSWSVRLLMNVSAGEDAAQEAMMKLFAKAHQFDPDRDVLTWGLTLATWECRSIRKKMWRQTVKDNVVPRVEHKASPEQQVIDADLLTLLEGLLGELSAADQGLLRLSRDEAPQAMSTMVRKRRERALGRLKDLWRSRHE